MQTMLLRVVSSGEAALAAEQEEDTLHKGLTAKSVLDSA